MGRADDAAAPLDAAALAALGIARPVTPDSGPWSWTTGNYAYDASGNITAIGQQSFAYDVLGRLVDATLVRPDQPGSEHETFAYDAFGNMTSRTGASAYSVATPASLATNHLTGATYDAAGNVTLLTPPGQAFQYEYTYDALGSLNQARAANVAGETRQFYIYTADDERIWTYDLGANTSHWKIRDLGARVLRDYVVTGNTWQLSRDYVYREGQLLAAVTPADTLSFSLDHLGTPRVITRADRTLVGFHQYLPYGEEWTNGAGVQEGEAKKFTSHERDRDPSGAGVTELDYMHARFYSGRVGRFLSVDPGPSDLRRPQTWNRYAYAENNPVNRIDLDGRQSAGFVAYSIRKSDEAAYARGEITAAELQRRSEVRLKVAVTTVSSLFGGTVAGRIFQTVVGAIRVTRYMGEGEAEFARRTGNIPNVDAQGNPRPTHVTTDNPINSSDTAQTTYELPVKPTHSATVPQSRVPGGLEPAPSGPTTSGGGSQAVTNQPIPVRPNEIKPLDQSIWQRVVDFFTK